MLFYPFPADEILNLDVIAMAMKEQEQRRQNRRKSRKVVPELEQVEDDVYVVETLSMTEPEVP